MRLGAVVRILGPVLLSSVLLSAGDTDGVFLLSMDELPIVATAIDSPTIRADVPLRTYRVGRESRPARAVRGPQRLARTITASAGRFETAIAPLTHQVTFSVSVAGQIVAREVGEPGAWTVVRFTLPASSLPVNLVETLTAPPEEIVLWTTDHMVPPGRTGKQPDVILISLDTTRPDYLTPYNPSEITTPTLARLAAEGMRFDQATSVSSWTMPGHMAMLTGVYPSLRLGFEERVEPDQTTLAEILAAAGYDTYGASGGPFTDSDFGFQQGFHSYLDSREWKNAQRITDWAIEKISRPDSGAPLFMFLNYFDAHEPGTGVTLDEWGAVDTGEKPLTPPLVDRVKAGYRLDLQAIDRQLTRLFETIRLCRDWNNTVVVVTSDHGQMLGERGSVGHAISLDEELLRVPLLVKGTKARPLRGAYRDQIQLTDVFPLVLDLSGVGKGGQVLRAVGGNRPVRNLAFMRLRHGVDERIVKRPRWRSSDLWAVRTDTVKVTRDREGRVTTVSVGANREEPIVAPELTSHLLSELDRFGTGDTGGGRALQLRSDLKDRLRALGYIR
jgi:arylsulfatase A-like enzyme